MTESSVYADEATQKDADSVTLLRILDVLYSLLADKNPQYFKAVADKHREGGLIGPQVAFDPQQLLDKD